MEAIDTHCHLSHTMKKGAKLNNIIQNAEKANVIAFIDSPVYVDEYKQSIRLHERHPNKIFVTLGIPPANYHELDIPLYMKNIRDYAEKGLIVGLGEVGLDYYWVKSTTLRNKQHEIFYELIAFANELNLPIIIHSRDAEVDAVKCLEKAETPVIMHSYSGSVETAMECVNRGYYISVPTSVVNRKKQRKIASNIPLENLVTETDSPYLSPLPDRRRNEPANVIYAVKEIAALKEQPEELVAQITTANAKKVFKLQC
jgi:TatD DNase family protein